MLRRTFLSVLALACAGCKRRQDYSAVTFESDVEHKVVVAIDLSGSFLDLMAEKGYAYEFLMQVLDKYGRDRSTDHIILAQLSGNNRPLLFEGTAYALRKKFPSANAFRDFLIANSDPGASRLADGFSDVLEYVVRDPLVRNRTVKTCCLVLSDLDNNVVSAKGDTSSRFRKALAAYKQSEGFLVFYFASTQPEIVDPWIRGLNESGIRYHMEGGIVDHPTLPSFD
jgi:hypothetical protein